MGRGWGVVPRRWGTAAVRFTCEGAIAVRAALGGGHSANPSTLTHQPADRPIEPLQRSKAETLRSWMAAPSLRASPLQQAVSVRAREQLAVPVRAQARGQAQAAAPRGSVPALAVSASRSGRRVHVRAASTAPAPSPR
jgi:hypothetical protein